MEALPSGLPVVVDDDEDLARFLTSSSQFNMIMVKPSAFLPNPRDGATSVFRHGGKPLDELWQIGIEVMAGDRTLHGAAVVKARHVRDVRLEVRPEEPPPRHANIVGWASTGSDPELAKARRKEQAALLAQQAELLRR
jgi:hypothetical protein